MYWVVEFNINLFQYWDLTDFSLSGSLFTLCELDSIKHCAQLAVL